MTKTDFFLSVLSLHGVTGEKGVTFFNPSLPIPSTSQTLSWAVTAESSPQHIAGSRTRTGKL